MFLQSHFNFILFFQSAFNIYSQFKTSCLPVTAPIWVCLDLTSDIHHLFASFCSLMKAQVRKNHQQAEPTGPLCIKDSITAMVIQERLPRNMTTMHREESLGGKGLCSSESHSSWVKYSVFKTSFSYMIQTDRGLCLPRFWDQSQNWDKIIMLHYELDGWFHVYYCIFMDFRGRKEIVYWNSWLLHSFTEQFCSRQHPMMAFNQKIALPVQR